MSFCRIFSCLVAVCTLMTCDARAQPLDLERLFPVDRVLEINITLSDEDWDTIRFQRRNIRSEFAAKRQYEPIKAPYTYVKAKLEIDGVEFADIGLRKKGFIGSQSSSRPSLKVKLDYTDKEAQIDGLDTLTLNNNKQDRSLLSQFMGYSFFNKLGSPAPRCSYAHVTVNGKNLGVYSHVESARSTMIENAFGISGGTMYEGTVVDFYDDWENSFDRKFGDDEAGRRKLKAVIDVLHSDESRNEDFDLESALAKHVDLEAFYKFWAIEGLLGFWDGYTGNRNNFFVYLNPKTDKLYFLPWGADCLFQKYSMVNRDRSVPVAVKTTGMLAHRLYQNPSCRERYRKTLLSIMESDWNEEKLLNEADRIEEMIEPFLAKVQQNPRKSNAVRRFIQNRREDIMNEISEEMPLWTKAPDRPPVIPDGTRAPRRAAPDNILWAAKNGNVDQIEKFLDSGVDVNFRDPNGTTPLSMAAFAGQLKSVELLIEKGADVNAKNNDGRTAMHGAAFFGQLETVKLLARNGGNIAAKGKEGDTPLTSASGNWDDVKETIDMFAGMLQLDLDMKKVKENRSKIAEFLASEQDKKTSR